MKKKKKKKKSEANPGEQEERDSHTARGDRNRTGAAEFHFKGSQIGKIILEGLTTVREGRKGWKKPEGGVYFC